MTNLSQVITPVDEDKMTARIWLNPSLGVSLDFASGHERSLNDRLGQRGINLEDSWFDSDEAAYVVRFTKGAGIQPTQIKAKMLECIQSYITIFMGLPPHKRAEGAIVVRDLQIAADCKGLA
jgi:hypothetical protein